jgi:hypothetical protein
MKTMIVLGIISVIIGVVILIVPMWLYLVLDYEKSIKNFYIMFSIMIGKHLAFRRFSCFLVFWPYKSVER